MVHERAGGVMSGRSAANRSETVIVPTQGDRSRSCASNCAQRQGSRWNWEWLARRVGQRDWRQGSTAREAIRQAVLLTPGKQPKRLLDAAARASAELEDL